MDAVEFLKTTSSYKRVQREKARGELSHAYLLTTGDRDELRSYLAAYASLIVCSDSSGACGTCRACKQTLAGAYADVKCLPSSPDKKLSVDDVAFVLEDAYFKPLEGTRKVYALSDLSETTAAVQNKLLKILEEPPKNVVFLLGATNGFSVLSTVKSRTEELTVPPLTVKEVDELLKEECPDAARRILAAESGDGTLTLARALYGNESFYRAMDFAKDTLKNFTKSSDLPLRSKKLAEENITAEELVRALTLLLRDLAVYFSDETQVAFRENLSFYASLTGYNRAATLYALDRLADAEKRLAFHSGDTMVTERVLLYLLEGKYQCRK